MLITKLSHNRTTPKPTTAAPTAARPAPIAGGNQIVEEIEEEIVEEIEEEVIEIIEEIAGGFGDPPPPAPEPIVAAIETSSGDSYRKKSLVL